MFGNYTIRAKLTIILMAVSSAVIALAGVSAFAIGVFMGTQSLKSDLITLALVLGDNCQASLTFTVPDDARNILATLDDKASIDEAAIYDSEGGLFAAYGKHQRQPPESLPALAAPRVSWSSIEVAEPIRLKGKVIGHVYLRDDLSQAKSALLRYTAAIGLVMLLSFAVAYFLALGLRGSISSPILKLASVARAVSKDQDYSIRAVRESDDEVGELIGSFNNMLDQIQARDSSLRASEEKFAQAFNLSPAMMILIEYESWIVRDVNAAWLQVLGLCREEVVGKSAADLDLIPDRMVREFIGQRLAQTGLVRDVETRVPTGEDEEKTIILSAELIEIGGSKFIIAAGDDVTERRHMAEQLLQAQKMEAVGRLAGGVAHDFNNVLAGIMNYAEMISLKLKDASDVRKYADNIVQLSERASALIRQLLAFSRRGKIMEVKVDVHDLVMEVISLLEHTIDRKIQIRSELRAGRSTVNGDPSQLQNAILNIAVNARDAMPRGGHLTFATEVASAAEARAAGVNESGAREYIRLTVSDTGVGMVETVKKHIFEPFFTTKEKGKGTGLGLAAVYGTVEDHKGAIMVESEPGQGSAFHLYLPLAEYHTGSEAPPDREMKKGRGLVLLVDDEEVLREVGRAMLTELGYEVVEAENGRHAVEKYSALHDRISLVILDVIMPEMSGIEAYALIKQINPEAKVLIASGFMLDQELASLLEQGIHGVIMKPFSMKELSLKLGEILGRTGQGPGRFGPAGEPG